LIVRALSIIASGDFEIVATPTGRRRVRTGARAAFVGGIR
jgi:hypothetical protein